MELRLPRFPRRPAPDPAAEAEKARARTVEAERRREESARNADRAQQEQERRRVAAAQRRQVAGEAARAALSWGANAWLEGSMWLCMAMGLLVDYIASYADLIATAEAFGYPWPVSWIMPLSIDLPATASVLGQLLAGRWKSSPWVRVRLGLLTLGTAPLTFVGNALRAKIITDSFGHHHFTFDPGNWALLAFAVPGIGVVALGYIASMMQGEKARLHGDDLAARTAAADAEREAEEAELARQERIAAANAARASSQAGSQVRSERAANRPANAGAKLVDPKVRRVARNGGTWKDVVAATGLEENAAKRALTEARKELRSRSQPESEADAQEARTPELAVVGAEG
jgi:hypothetical protein